MRVGYDNPAQQEKEEGKVEAPEEVNSAPGAKLKEREEEEEEESSLRELTRSSAYASLGADSEMPPEYLSPSSGLSGGRQEREFEFGREEMSGGEGEGPHVGSPDGAEAEMDLEIGLLQMMEEEEENEIKSKL